MKARTYDLEKRLLEYAVMIIRLVESLDDNKAGNHVGNQFLRSGTSPLFNHGEAQAAESSRDFIHKMRICLKEFRESRRALLLIQKVPLTKMISRIDPALEETDELIKIFVISIRTARKNLTGTTK